MTINQNTKKVKLKGLDGNAFVLLAAFSHAAKKQKFSSEWIESIISEATNGDYNHLLITLQRNCE